MLMGGRGPGSLVPPLSLGIHTPFLGFLSLHQYKGVVVYTLFLSDLHIYILTVAQSY